MAWLSTSSCWRWYPFEWPLKEWCKHVHLDFLYWLVDCMVFAAWDSWQKYTMFRSNSFVQFDLNKWLDRMNSLQQSKSRQTCKTQEHLGLSSRHVSFMSWWNPPGQASWVKSIHHLGFQKLEPHSACHIQNQKCSNQKRGNLATWKHTYDTYIH